MSILKLPFKTPCIYHIDPLFDLRLGNFDTQALEKGASQLALLFPAAIDSCDAVISDIKINPEFYAYLSENFKEWGKIIPLNSIDNNKEIKFWGWDNLSNNFADENNFNCSYPNIDTVKEANSRKFCHRFNLINKTGIPDSHYCNDFNELTSIIKKSSYNNIVLKPDYGNAGHGFIRLNNGIILKEYEKDIAEHFKKGYGIVIEPWLDRVSDISSGFILSPKGKILESWHHQTLCNHAGTYFANYVYDSDPIIQKYKSTLQLIVNELAKYLHNVGYFGPVGFDSFEYKTDDKNISFASSIEINARMNVGMIARSILSKVSDCKPSLFRFISKKRHKLPDNYKELKEELGDLNYNQNTKTGVILITPLRVDYGFGFVKTARSAFVIVANSPDELWEMDEELRNRLS